MDRRDFLSLMGKGAMVLALGGLETMLNGCFSTLPELNKPEFNSYYNSIIRSIEDPHNYLTLLKEDEYIVPDDILDAYASTVDKQPEGAAGKPLGGYLHRNYLTFGKKKEFLERLKELGLSDDEIAFYCTLLTRSDIIILRASILKRDEIFEKILSHERFHKKMKELSKKDYNYMIKVAKELLKRRDKDGYRFVRERLDSEYIGGRAFMYAQTNPEEFYTYLAQGEFIPKVEKVLKTEYPKAYKIFDRIREECRLK